jgi:hypothetical protein
MPEESKKGAPLYDKAGAFDLRDLRKIDKLDLVIHKGGD